MASLLKVIEQKVQAGFSVCNWHLLEKRRYFQEDPFLKRPEKPLGEADLSYKKLEFYEDGFVILNSNRYTQVAQAALPSFRRDFEEAIRFYEVPGQEDKKLVRIDNQRRFWSGGTTSGVIRLVFEDRDHPVYEEIFGREYARSQAQKGVATVKELYARYPFLRDLVEESDLVSMARYANDGDPHPVAIQIERKTHSTGAEYNFIHFDALRSTFKAYLYLTDVEEGSGPLAISPGSHHWKRYPLMLEEMMARRKTRFTLEETRRYGIPPMAPVCGKAGSLFCFTSNAIHSATNLAPDRERWSIQLYYYSPKRYSSDWS